METAIFYKHQTSIGVLVCVYLITNIKFKRLEFGTFSWARISKVSAHPSVCSTFLVKPLKYMLSYRYNSYPPPGKRLKTKEILIHPTHLLPYPKFGWRPKSDQKWVFTNFGPAIYSCKADGKKISKSQKEIDLPHPLPTPSKIWSWALKLLQKKVHYVWLCHKPLESPWKGDFKRRKIL